ncbi:hypothetical protein B0H14DRAFT_202071 [Mycena olivaceomarginata]|nr:hypothetical protein B0H14DRAFT_202071 [Mycena olivaceomarginata]
MTDHGRGEKISHTPPSNLSTRHDGSRPQALCMRPGDDVCRLAQRYSRQPHSLKKKRRKEKPPREGRVHALEKTRHARNKHRRVPKHDVCARNHYSRVSPAAEEQKKRKKRETRKRKEKVGSMHAKTAPVEKEVKNARPTSANAPAAAPARAKLSTAYPALFPPVPLEFALAAFDENPPLPPLP